MKVWILTIICAIIPAIYGHGRLMVPPARGTAWRFEFNTPINYNDNELNCGGFDNQWNVNSGSCGLCGDPSQGPRVNEAGGLYATGTIVRSYTSGDIIDVTVQITANHEGYHQFRLCEHNDPSTNITQECLDEHLLPDATYGNTKHLMSPAGATIDYLYQVQLPSGITCSHCVLQWKYTAGNNWGTDSETGQSGLGYGPQEEFYGCADVSISGGGSNTPTPAPTTTTTEGATTTTTAAATTTTSETTTTTTTTTTSATTTTNGGTGGYCVAVYPHSGVAGMDNWCVVNCAAGYCPSSHCDCGNNVNR